MGMCMFLHINMSRGVHNMRAEHCETERLAEQLIFLLYLITLEVRTCIDRALFVRRMQKAHAHKTTTM